MSSSKGIGFWSGCQLLINNTVGPALVLLPSLFQQFGYLSVLFILFIVSVLSVLSALMLTQTLHDYITNKTKHRLYSELEEEEEEEGITLYHVIQQYISNKFMLKTILSIYIIALVLRLMAVIIQSGQIIDYAIRDIFMKTCALGFDSQNLSIICTQLPFQSSLYIFSFGFGGLMIICIILFKTMNFNNISDSILLQWFANIIVVILLFIWLYIFWNENTFQQNRISVLYKNWNNNDYHLSHIVSVISANFTFIIPIPSWYTQKDKNINNQLIMKTFIYSIIFVFILFTLIGIFGGMAYSQQIYQKYDNNLFTVLNESIYSTVIGKISVYVFPIAQNITTIPVLCIIIAYNIKHFRINYQNSLIISSIAPWIISLLFFNGDGFNIICDWNSIFFTVINYILPPAIYIKMKTNTYKIRDTQSQYLIEQISHQQHNNSNIEKNSFIIIAYSMIILSVLLCTISIYDKLFV